MDILRNHRNACRKYLLVLGCLSQLFCLHPSYANFVNSGFESAYTPSSRNPHNPITGYIFQGNATTAAPTSSSGISLSADTTPGGVSDILVGSVQSLYDYFLAGATPTPTLLLPIIGSQTAMINLRSVDDPLTKVGTSNPVSGRTAMTKQASLLAKAGVTSAPLTLVTPS